MNYTFLFEDQYDYKMGFKPDKTIKISVLHCQTTVKIRYLTPCLD